MSKPPTSRMAFGSHPVTGAPYVAEVADSTMWPSESATRQSLQTLVEIHNHGYVGLRFEYSRLNTSETLISRCVDLSTPEGRLVTIVMALAERGRALPTEKALGILKKIYLSEGLTPPTPRPLCEQICLSPNEA